jgi:hypothetical protein
VLKRYLLEEKENVEQLKAFWEHNNVKKLGQVGPVKKKIRVKGRGESTIEEAADYSVCPKISTPPLAKLLPKKH